jgi:hypothetical protein
MLTPQTLPVVPRLLTLSLRLRSSSSDSGSIGSSCCCGGVSTSAITLVAAASGFELSFCTRVLSQQRAAQACRVLATAQYICTQWHKHGGATLCVRVHACTQNQMKNITCNLFTLLTQMLQRLLPLFRAERCR